MKVEWQVPCATTLMAVYQVPNHATSQFDLQLVQLALTPTSGHTVYLRDYFVRRVWKVLSFWKGFCPKKEDKFDAESGGRLRRRRLGAPGSRHRRRDPRRQPRPATAQVERAGALHTLGLLAVLYRGSRQGCVLLDW